jgi:multidrug transporter EmrE-like cation transporter
MNWLYLLGFGALIQAVIITAMRQYGIGFWLLLPLTILMQWLFMTAYASKDMPFTVIWFTAAGITALLSLWMGLLLFKDQVSAAQWLGLVTILVGIVLTRLSAI